MTCSVWPKSKTFGCNNGSNWQLLNLNMDTSSTTSCEFLCRLRKERGCCYLHDGSSIKQRGCWWKSGGEAYEGQNSSATGIAVTCAKIGTSPVFSFH